MIRVQRQPPKPGLTLTIDGVDYDVEVASMQVPRFKLTRLRGEDTYDVSAGGCTCPAYTFGDAVSCKHLAALMAVGLLPTAVDSPSL